MNNDSTNQDDLRLKQMLEEITAADPSTTDLSTIDPATAGPANSPPGDAEAASLREAWRAFEELIRAADASLPIPDIANSMPAVTSVAAQKPQWSRSRWIGLVAATAAAVLLALTFGWWIRRDDKPGHRGPSVARSTAPEQPEAAVVQAEKSPNKQPPAGMGVAAKGATSRAANSTAATSQTALSTWDDALETQIAAVSQQIGYVEQNWQHRVDDVDLVQYRIDEVTDALQNDKL